MFSNVGRLTGTQDRRLNTASSSIWTEVMMSRGTVCSSVWRMEKNMGHHRLRWWSQHPCKIGVSPCSSCTVNPVQIGLLKFHMVRPVPLKNCQSDDYVPFFNGLSVNFTCSSNISLLSRRIYNLPFSQY